MDYGSGSSSDGAPCGSSSLSNPWMWQRCQGFNIHGLWQCSKGCQIHGCQRWQSVGPNPWIQQCCQGFNIHGLW